MASLTFSKQASCTTCYSCKVTNLSWFQQARNGKKKTKEEKKGSKWKIFQKWWFISYLAATSITKVAVTIVFFFVTLTMWQNQINKQLSWLFIMYWFASWVIPVCAPTLDRLWFFVRRCVLTIMKVEVWCSYCKLLLQDGKQFYDRRSLSCWSNCTATINDMKM